MYGILATVALGIAAVAAVLAAAGAALQSNLSTAAAALCAAVFVVPGVYFLAHSRRLRARDVALAHAAAFARSRGTLRIQELAEELVVSQDVAERILRAAIREGHLTGNFEGRDRFVTGREDGSQSAGRV